jgi:hypothetical protein
MERAYMPPAEPPPLEHDTWGAPHPKAAVAGPPARPPDSTLLRYSASHSERLFLPLKRPCRRDRGTAQAGGEPTIAEAMVSGEVARSRLCERRERLPLSLLSSMGECNSCGSVRFRQNGLQQLAEKG